MPDSDENAGNTARYARLIVLMQDRRLWGNTKLPEWDLDRFYELYHRVVSGTANRIERDIYGGMLMYQVGMVVRKESWRRSLAQAGLEDAEAAAAVLKRLCEKVPRLRMNTPCPKVLISCVIRTINRELISFIRANTRKSKLPVQQASDDFDRRDPTYESPMLSGLRQAIAEAKQSMCGDSYYMGLAYDFMSRMLLSGSGIPAFDEIPTSISARISADDHAEILIGLNKITERYAQDHGAYAG